MDPKPDDCMLKVSSLSWHSGVDFSTISRAIRDGDLPLSAEHPRRVKACDFEVWLDQQQHVRRYKGRMARAWARWVDTYHSGAEAPNETYPRAAPSVAEQVPEPGPQLELVAGQATPAGPDYRDMLIRTLEMLTDLTGLLPDEVPDDVAHWWASGPGREAELERLLQQRADLDQEIADLRKEMRPHGALTDDEIAALEAA